MKVGPDRSGCWPPSPPTLGLSALAVHAGIGSESLYPDCVPYGHVDSLEGRGAAQTNTVFVADHLPSFGAVSGQNAPDTTVRYTVLQDGNDVGEGDGDSGAANAFDEVTQGGAVGTNLLALEVLQTDAS